MTAPSTRAKTADALSVIDADAPPTEAFAFVNAADQIVAQYAAGAPLADTTGPFVMVAPLRTVRIVLGVSGANPVVFTIAGTDQGGSAQTETISCAGAGTYEGSKLWQTITSFSSNIDPGGTVNLRCSGYAYFPATRYIYCGGSGNLVVMPQDGSTLVTYAVTTFQSKKIRAKWISLTSTATLIVAER